MAAGTRQCPAGASVRELQSGAPQAGAPSVHQGFFFVTFFKTMQ